MDERPTRLLLVEDNPTDVAIALDALAQGQKRGQFFAVEQVKRLDDAITKLAAQAFDVVLLDLDLPDSHGLGTLLAVRRASSDVPIVICSGIENEETAIAALKQGAQEYLVKGRITGWLTRRAIRHAIERKRMAKQVND